MVIRRDEAITEQSLIMKNKDDKGDKGGDRPERGERRRRDDDEGEGKGEDAKSEAADDNEEAA